MSQLDYFDLKDKLLLALITPAESSEFDPLYQRGIRLYENIRSNGIELRLDQLQNLEAMVNALNEKRRKALMEKEAAEEE